MTPTPQDPGTPIAVDVDSIELELQSLWASASDQQGEPALVRACSCNLIVVAQNAKEARDLQPVLARVAESHPARFMIAYSETEAPAAGTRIDAWISAHCTTGGSGRPQICSESITLAAAGSAPTELANTLVSLLVPDLQVFAYWRAFRASDAPIVQRLAEFADLLIVDSHFSREDPRGRERLFQLLTTAPDGTVVRDLNWERLTDWRDLIAQFFDLPSVRSQAYEISEVEIHRAISSLGGIPTRTLLLTGWLASRLGWRRVASERSGQDWISRWSSRSGEVVVRFSGTPAEPGNEGISSVVLRTRSGASFSAERQANASCITSSASGFGGGINATVPQAEQDEAALLIRELSVPGDDVVFREALQEAVALEKSFR